MKTTNKILRTLIVIVVIIFIYACKGEKGDIGPSGTNGNNGTAGATGQTGATRATGVGTPGATGAKGDKGDTGAKGDKGDTGTTGATGTANVLYSDWLDLIPNVLPSFQTTIVAHKITQNILDTGDVRVYLKIPNDNNLVTLLPYSTLSYNIFLGKIVFSVSGAGSVINRGLKIRYIIIPGGISIGSGRKAAVDYTDYEAVKAYYNLVD